MTDLVRQVLWSAWDLPYFVRVLILVYVAAWSALLLHELAHALVARALGVRVWSIALGRGPGLWQGLIAGSRVKLALLPLHGEVSLHDEDAHGLGYRATALRDCRFDWSQGSSWRAPVISAAGSVANLLAAAGLALYWLSMPRLAPPSRAVFVACFAANLAMCLNLAPVRGLDGWRLLVHASAWLRRPRES